MGRELHVDVETYSDVDLLKCGMYAYAESRVFDIILLAYAFDDGPVRVIDIARCERIPNELFDGLTDPNILKTAFNAPFERVCLAKQFMQEMPAAQWACTSILARELGLPGSLDGVCRALKLPEDKAKQSIGKTLIKYFCVPNDRKGVLMRNHPGNDLEKWERFKEYNRQDVEAEREVRRILSRFEIHSRERDYWLADQTINDRGVLVDAAFALNAAKMDADKKKLTKEKAQILTGLENPSSAAQMKRWIAETSGIEVESLRKEHLQEVRAAADDESVDEALRLRAGLSKSSTAKYDAMLRVMCKDHRARGLTQFYGAARTGRWAGRLIQTQNLPKNLMPDSDLDIARRLVRAGDADGLDMLFGDTADTLSQLVRTALIPKPGHVFVAADFSAIEARVLAWLAGEKWRMDVFNGSGKIYEASAEQMFHLPPGSVKKGDPMRQRGKVAELALGYGGSVGALINMGAIREGLEEAELLGLVKAWRGASPAITSWWWAVEAACRTTVETKRPSERGNDRPLGHGIRFRAEGPLLRLRLPSGRELSYVRPGLEPDVDRPGKTKITYWGTQQNKQGQSTSGWCKLDTYGPKLVENIVQAVARDCLAEAMLRIETAGLPIVFHVHDEVVTEVPEGWRSPEGKTATQAIADIMSIRPDWAADLPLRADAYECYYYRKD